MKNNYPDSLTIQQYLDGLLNPEEMHELEKKALDDPFLWDALEGYRYSNDHTENLSFLQRQLQERIVHLQENKKVFDFTWQRLSVAAAAAVLFISAGILFWMNSNQLNTKMANNESKQVEVALTDADSLYTSEETVQAADLPQPESSHRASNPVIQPQEKASQTVIGVAPPAEATGSSPVVQAKDADVQIASSAIASRTTVADSEVAAAKKESVVMRSRLRDASILNEVLIDSPDSLFSMPLFGWDHYKDYLKTNLKQPQMPQPLKGTVVLESFVDQYGELSGTTIEKSLSPQQDAEALRLLREGPKWRPSPNQTPKRIRLEIEF